MVDNVLHLTIISDLDCGFSIISRIASNFLNIGIFLDDSSDLRTLISRIIIPFPVFGPIL